MGAAGLRDLYNGTPNFSGQSYSMSLSSVSHSLWLSAFPLSHSLGVCGSVCVLVCARLLRQTESKWVRVYSVYMCCNSTITSRKTTNDLTLLFSPLAGSLSLLFCLCSRHWLFGGKNKLLKTESWSQLFLYSAYSNIVLRQNGSVILATFDRAPF